MQQQQQQQHERPRHRGEPDKTSDREHYRPHNLPVESAHRHVERHVSTRVDREHGGRATPAVTPPPVPPSASSPALKSSSAAASTSTSPALKSAAASTSPSINKSAAVSSAQLQHHSSHRKGAPEVGSSSKLAISEEVPKIVPKKSSSKRKHPALHEAVLEGTDQVLEVLQSSDVNTRSPVDSSTALHVAAGTGSRSIVKILVEAGAMIDLQDENDNTPLHVAIANSHSKVAIMLLPVCTQRVINKRNVYGDTALHIAAAQSLVEVVKALLDSSSSANPNIANEKGLTPLHVAIEKNNTPIVQLLLAAKADPNAVGPQQQSPLHMAVHDKERSDIVALLLKSKANPHAVDADGKIPLFYAVRQHFDGITNQLTQTEFSGDICLVYEIKQQMLIEEHHKNRTLSTADSTVAPTLTVATATATATATTTAATTTTSATPTKEASEAPIDRYGFYGRGGDTSPAAIKKELERAVKWNKLMKNWEKAKPKIVHGRCVKGIPDRCRGEAWKLLAGVPEIRDKNPTIYKLLLASQPPPRVASQLDLDIKRAHLQHEMFHQTFGSGQITLFNVLRAYSVYDPVLGYTQGMADIAGFLLMYMTEEDAFWMLVQLMKDKYGLRAMLSEGFPGLYRVGYIQEHMLQETFSEMQSFLKKKGLTDFIAPYLMEWYMLAYLRILPFELTLRVFDVFLCEGYTWLFSVALGIFKMFAKDIFGEKDECLLQQKLKDIGKCFVDTQVAPTIFVKFAEKNKCKSSHLMRFGAEYDAIQQQKERLKPAAATATAASAPIKLSHSSSTTSLKSGTSTTASTSTSTSKTHAATPSNLAKKGRGN
ncbi:Rab-GTPase-TBC domain [Pelomyxa schiedti]|nr:Rab-GTPase-TBC domain [Pelomyxa schiedti]